MQKGEKEKIYSIKNNNTFFEFIVIPAMRNIDFSLNFLVDRQKLDKYININTDFNSLLETSFGYTGTNIKIKIDEDINNLDLDLITIHSNGKINKGTIKYGEYIKKLPIKERKKKQNKVRRNTFLVFHSGKVIMSGMCYKTMINHYYKFLKIIMNCKNEIEEQLEK